MKRNVIKLLTVICLLCALALTVTACKGVKMTISFVVDGTEYATIDTSGNEVVTIPQSPAKQGYTFDGWYWDDGTWQRPFTANSLLNEPLTSNMSVYAKFTEIHYHVLTLQPAVKANCEHVGNEAYYTCTCGKLFADAQATVELTAIPTINKTEHTPTDWIVDGKATCTENGSKHIECAVCHATLQTESIPSSGHTPETEWKIDKNAACTVDGSKHLECSVCHTTLQTEVIPATGHSYATSWSSDERGHWHAATCEHTSETTQVEGHTYDKNFKCKICGYQDTSLHGTSIATEVFNVENETLYAKVPNTQTTFSFINAIQVADDATFVVATDLAASNVIRTKTVSLEIGDNTYYVLVENGNDIQLYTVTLRRRPIYTVTFVTNGGTACDSQQVEEDSLATEPTISKTGYTFTGWSYDFAMPITQNTTVTASWTANEYTVTYDVNDGVLADTQFNATYDSAYTLAVPTREGHTFQGWYVDDMQITYANGRSRTNWTYLENKTATAKWTINSYTLTITNPNTNAGTVTGDGTYVYDSEITVTASEPNLGYEWIGWYDGDNLITADLSYSFSMPAKSVSLTAKYRLLDEMSNFNFTATTTTCTITGVKDKAVTEIFIPEYVTSIGNSAFSYNSGLTSVTIGNSVTSIGDQAFYGCSKIASINYLGTMESWCAGNVKGLNCLMDYGTNSKTFSLNGVPVTELIIPSTVTSIPSYAFAKTNITSVTFEENSQCTSIDSNAFRNCINISSITIGKNVTTIDKDSFINCTSLTSITIPNSVTSIGDFAFFNCTSLTNVTIGNGVTNIGSVAFNGCSKLANINYLGTIESWCKIQGLYNLMNYGTSSKTFSLNGVPVTNLVIPNTVTSIPSYAFEYCTSLTSVTVPDSVSNIGNDSFRGCSNLESMTIPFVGATKDGTSNTHFGYIFGANDSNDNSDFVPSALKTVILTGGTRIAANAFYNCSNITNITIPNSITTISNNAFDNCYKLVEVYNLSELDITAGSSNNGYVAYYAKRVYTSIDEQSSLTQTSDGYLFYDDDNNVYLIGYAGNETELTLPDNFNNKPYAINQYSFYNCDSLTSVTIPNSIISIGSNAFSGCSSLTSVNYLGDIVSWCNISFDNAYANPLSNGANLFLNGECIADGELIIPDAVTAIRPYAFCGCISITSVIICNVESIGSSAFSGCSGLKNMSLGNSTKSIGYSAFADCSSLTSIVITNSVTSIDASAFRGCSSLTSITVSDENTTYHSNGNCLIATATGTLVIGCKNSVIPTDGSVRYIGDWAFDGRSSLTSVTIPDSIISIGYNAFFKCSKLRTVYFTGTIAQWNNIKKYNNWKYQVPATKVTCSDGTVSI